MSFRVTMWNPDNESTIVKHYLSRAQAIHGARKRAYECLSAFGKLDTAAAHAVMAAIDSCDDIIPPQDQRHVTISNTGFTLTISNTARAPR